MIDFSRRAEDLRELMDDPACDARLLFRTYEQFTRVNRLLCRWGLAYRTWIRPAMEKGRAARLLDIGFGGGDIPRRLYRLARADGFDLAVTAIDTDPRAMHYIEAHPAPEPVRYRCASAADLLAAGETFDFITGNHLLHHLPAPGIGALCAEASRLATRCVVFNDIARSPVAYGLFTAFGALFLPDSFAAHDGRLSIRRGFAEDELQGLLPGGWIVVRRPPYRLMAVLRK